MHLLGLTVVVRYRRTFDGNMIEKTNSNQENV